MSDWRVKVCANCRRPYEAGDVIRINLTNREPHHTDCDDPKLQNVDADER